MVTPERVASLKSILNGASRSGVLTEQLRAAGVPTTWATVLYADSGTPYFAPPVVATSLDSPSDTSDGGGSDVGLIVGLAVGIPAGLAVLGAAGVVAARKRRGKKGEAPPPADENLPPAEKQAKSLDKFGE